MFKRFKIFSCGISFIIIMCLSCTKEDFNPIETGFVTYISFDENLDDANNYTTVIANERNTTAFIPGIKGKGLELIERSPSRAVLYDTGVFTNSDNLSVSVWVKSKAASESFILHSTHFSFTNSNTNFFKFIIWPDSDEGEPEYAQGQFIDDEWTHVVGTYNGKVIKCYINGELIEVNNYKDGIGENTRSHNLEIGLNGWDGAIDELYIYDSVLSEEQIAILYNI